MNRKLLYAHFGSVLAHFTYALLIRMKKKKRIRDQQKKRVRAIIKKKFNCIQDTRHLDEQKQKTLRIFMAEQKTNIKSIH